MALACPVRKEKKKKNMDVSEKIAKFMSLIMGGPGGLVITVEESFQGDFFSIYQQHSMHALPRFPPPGGLYGETIHL